MKSFLQKTLLSSKRLVTPKLSDKIAQAGFTLVEFVVILAIFAIMAGVALFNFRGFESRVTLTNLAHDIALTIRQAQVFGISASESIQLSDTVFESKTRGVHFLFNEETKEFDKTFTIFVDRTPPNDGLYNERTDPTVDQITINSSDRVTRIMLDNGSSEAAASDDVHISFTRPKPDATILSTGSTTSYQAATIVIESLTGEEREIHIQKSGQISIVPFI
jgi:Tfp pilus assembly protein FimT